MGETTYLLPIADSREIYGCMCGMIQCISTMNFSVLGSVKYSSGLSPEGCGQGWRPAQGCYIGQVVNADQFVWNIAHKSCAFDQPLPNLANHIHQLQALSIKRPTSRRWYWYWRRSLWAALKQFSILMSVEFPMTTQIHSLDHFCREFHYHLFQPSLLLPAVLCALQGYNCTHMSLHIPIALSLVREDILWFA